MIEKHMRSRCIAVLLLYTAPGFGGSYRFRASGMAASSGKDPVFPRKVTGLRVWASVRPRRRISRVTPRFPA